MIFSELSFEEKFQEIALIAVILGDHHLKDIYTSYEDSHLPISYLTCAEIISKFAVEFFNANLSVDWSIDDNFLVDAVVNFGEKRIKKFIEEGV